MIEMQVQAVTIHPRTGRSVAVVEPKDAAEASGLLVGISRAEACSLAHELQDQDTLRGQGFMLLARCLEVHASRPRAIYLVPAPSGLATARLELAWSDGRSEATIGVGLALGLAVTLGVPLLVSEALLDGTRIASKSAPADAPPPSAEPKHPDPSGPYHTHALRAGPDAPASSVPDAFRRAFGGPP